MRNTRGFLCLNSGVSVLQYSEPFEAGDSHCSARSSPRFPLTGDKKVHRGSISRMVYPIE